MMKLKNNYLIWCLLGVLLISLIVSINILLKRYMFENQSNHIEIAVSYNEMKQLSILGSQNITELLEKMRDEARITSVAIEEDTVQEFVERGKMTVLKGSEIMNMYRVGHVNRFLLTHLYKQIKVKPDCFYLIIEEKEDYERIRNFLSVEFGKDNVRRIGRLNILEVIDSYDDLMNLRVGISELKVNTIKSLGLIPIIRLANSNRLNKYVIKQKFLSFTNDIQKPVLIFEGNTALGYPNHLSIVEETIRDYEIRLGFVEFTKRLGEKQLALQLPESVVRIHTITNEEMESLSRKQAIQRYVRAGRERGIKVLFIRPFFQGYHQESMIDFNIQFIRKVGGLLLNHGKKLAPLNIIKSQSYQSAKTWEILILSLGVLTIMLFLINFFFKLTLVNFLMINSIFIVVFLISVTLQLQTLWVQLMALLAAIIFPSFAMISQFPIRYQSSSLIRKLYNAVLYMISVVGITLIGAFLIVGFLSDLRFIEGVSRFFGVKTAFIAPLIIVGIFYYFKPHRLSSMMYILKRVFQAPVSMSSIISVIFALLFITLLLLRSGNYIGMPSLFYEEQFREFLENILFVRPRTKEFLIGYPFLIFSYWAVDHYISRRWVWLFNGIGLVSLISMINSFCHIHTPLNISIYRTCMGIVIGTIIGLIYIALFYLCNMIYRRLLR